ncbi:MAG: hypothetical protein KAS38_16870, partial [Anaerolineales bacterium]|nr:hypothetical protein [Anaerolineales bacterium]
MDQQKVRPVRIIGHNHPPGVLAKSAGVGLLILGHFLSLSPILARPLNSGQNRPVVAESRHHIGPELLDRCLIFRLKLRVVRSECDSHAYIFTVLTLLLLASVTVHG